MLILKLCNFYAQKLHHCYENLLHSSGFAEHGNICTRERLRCGKFHFCIYVNIQQQNDPCKFTRSSVCI